MKIPCSKFVTYIYTRNAICIYHSIDRNSIPSIKLAKPNRINRRCAPSSRYRALLIYAPLNYCATCARTCRKNDHESFLSLLSICLLVVNEQIVNVE